jgi:hypothetical protein
MPEIMVEAIPFVLGAAIGLLTFDRAKPWPELTWLAGGSLLIGSLQSFFAGELGGSLLGGAAAIVLDSMAVAIAWAGAHFAVRYSSLVTQHG